MLVDLFPDNKENTCTLELSRMSSSLALKVARRIRTFDLTATVRSHPFLLYWGLCGVLFTWANYAQHQRLAPMFPDFEKYREREGGRMLDAKRQEFADVMRYNNMVSSMRRDLNH